MTHQARSVQPCVDIVVFRRRLDLQNDLDKTTREVLYKNDLLQRLLQNKLEMAFTGTYICANAASCVQSGLETKIICSTNDMG